MKTIALIITLAALPAFAGFKITKLEQTQNKVKVDFITEEVFESICRLEIDSVSLSTPRSAYESGLTNTESGVINVAASVHADSRCFLTGGVHNGSIELDKGQALPRLVKGETYELRINGKLVKSILVE